MNRLSDAIIEEAIDAVESGLSVKEVVARYPRWEAELRPILETTVQLSQIRVAHSLHAQEQSRVRMLAVAEEMRSALVPGNSHQRRLPRLVFGFAGLVIILLILSYGLVVTSSSAVPGDALYRPKQAFETIRLSLERDPLEQESLEAQFARERLREVAQLLDEGRRAEVDFGGTINNIDADQWIVAGLPVSLEATTQIIGQPQNGAYAQIKGETRGKMVSASLIEIRSTARIEPDGKDPKPPVEEAPTRDDIPVITRAISHTPTPSRTPPATATPTATPTSTPTSTPTLLPTPENILPEPVATISIDDGTEEPGGSSGDAGEEEEEHEEEEEEDDSESSDSRSSGDYLDDGESDDKIEKEHEGGGD